jgi:hypothetical protein
MYAQLSPYRTPQKTIYLICTRHDWTSAQYIYLPYVSYISQIRDGWLSTARRTFKVNCRLFSEYE